MQIYKYENQNSQNTFTIIYRDIYRPGNVQDVLEKNQWSIEEAEEWYANNDWLIGANFVPSTAINQLEMWQEDSFDPDTIDKELGYAKDIGM